MENNVKTDVTSRIHYIFSPNFVFKHDVKLENIEFGAVVVVVVNAGSPIIAFERNLAWSFYVLCSRALVVN